MTASERVRQILEIKARHYHIPVDQFSFRPLIAQWQSGRVECADYFPIRIVTLLEVFTRSWIAALVDHGSPFIENAIGLSKKLNVKLDFDLLRHLEGRAISFGDLISHTVSINRFEQIVGVLSEISGGPLLDAIRDAVDRWAVEIEGKAEYPIIPDKDAMCHALARLFEVRHILCHEVPRSPVYENSEIDGFLRHGLEFVHATAETLHTVLYGKSPLTQGAMTQRAFDKLKAAELAMEEVLVKVRERWASDPTRSELLEKSRSRWREYRELQSRIAGDTTRGGSMSPMSEAYEASEMTQRRTKVLGEYLTSTLYDPIPPFPPMPSPCPR
jgi:uncharacterized protein YecT (DUF1311 family)